MTGVEEGFLDIVQRHRERLGLSFLRPGTRDPADGGGRYLITPANPAKKKARKQARASRRTNRKTK